MCKSKCIHNEVGIALIIEKPLRPLTVPEWSAKLRELARDVTLVHMALGRKRSLFLVIWQFP